jgi:hypothetical protein
LFEIFLTDQARNQLKKLKADKGLNKRYNAVKKTINFLSSDPRYKSLKTHEFTSLKGPGEKKFLKLMLNNLLLQHTGSFGAMAPVKIRSPLYQ